MRTNSVNIQPLSEVKYMFSFHSTALALLSSAGFTPPFRLQKQAEMDAQSLRVTATSLGCTGWWGWGGLTGWEWCELFCQQAWSSCSIPAWGYPNMGLWSIQIHQVKQEIQMLTGHWSVTFGKATITRKISSPGHDLLAAIWKRGKMHAFFFFSPLGASYRESVQQRTLKYTSATLSDCTSISNIVLPRCKSLQRRRFKHCDLRGGSPRQQQQTPKHTDLLFFWFCLPLPPQTWTIAMKKELCSPDLKNTDDHLPTNATRSLLKTGWDRRKTRLSMRTELKAYKLSSTRDTEFWNFCFPLFHLFQ